MAGTGASYAWLACLIGGQRLVERFVPRDDAAYAAAVPYLDSFYQAAVVEGRLLRETEVAPQVEGAGSDMEALRDIADAQAPATSINDLPALRPLLEQYAQLKERQKVLDESLDHVKAQILGIAVEAGTATVTDGKRKVVSLRISNRTTLDKKAVAAAGIDLTPYETSSESRAWYVTP
jgi:predicted phage-related endonuclease